MGGGAKRRAIVGSEDEALLHGGVVRTRMAGGDVRGVLRNEVVDVELLREVDGSRLAVAGDGDAQEPLKLTFVVRGEAGGERGHEASTKSLVIGDDEHVVNIDGGDEDGATTKVEVEARVDVGSSESPTR